MTAHIYSSASNTSRAVFPGSLGNNDPRYDNYNNYIVKYSGFVIASSPSIDPLGLYLAPVPSDPMNQVDVWTYIHNHQSQHRVQAVQTEGSFTRSFANELEMPLNGYIKLYRNPNKSYW